MRTKGLPRARLAVVVLLIVLAGISALAVAATSAPAGNRDPKPGLIAYPGPAGKITFGQEVGYTATLFNGPNLKSQLTHVLYTHKIPITTIGGDEVKAELLYASCDNAELSLGTFTDTHYSCPETTVAAGGTGRVTLIWGTPSIDEPLTCDADADPEPQVVVNTCLLISDGQWTIKEGTGKPGSQGPDTFPDVPLEITTPLHGDTEDPQKADGYVLNGLDCSGSNVAIQTFEGTLGPNNRIVTKVCPSTVPGPGESIFSPGLVIKIAEGGSGIPPGLQKRVTDTSFVCIPAPDPNEGFGNNCPTTLGYGNPGYSPWTFSPKAKFSFVIDLDELLVNGEQIDQVYHNGFEVTDDCVITINHPDKKAFITCLGDENGGWDFT